MGTTGITTGLSFVSNILSNLQVVADPTAGQQNSSQSIINTAAVTTLTPQQQNQIFNLESSYGNNGNITQTQANTLAGMVASMQQTDGTASNTTTSSGSSIVNGLTSGVGLAQYTPAVGNTSFDQFIQSVNTIGRPSSLIDNTSDSSANSSSDGGDGAGSSSTVIGLTPGVGISQLTPVVGNTSFDQFIQSVNTTGLSNSSVSSTTVPASSAPAAMQIAGDGGSTSGDGSNNAPE
jgi:hypothetical protein